MPSAVIIDAIRTPIGALGGSLAGVRPDDLAALVIRTIVERNRLDPASIEEVFLGCANQAGEDNRNVARMAALLAELPPEVAGVTINRLCASGLSAVNQAARAIIAGDGELYVAGGVESMSRAPYSIPKAEAPFSFGNLTAWDTALGWRYPNPLIKAKYGTESMGETAENIALERPQLTRSSRMPLLFGPISGLLPPSTQASSPRRSSPSRYRRKRVPRSSSGPMNDLGATPAWNRWRS